MYQGPLSINYFKRQYDIILYLEYFIRRKRHIPCYFPILHMYLLISLEQNKLKVVTDKQSGVLADEQTDRWIDK